MYTCIVLYVTVITCACKCDSIKKLDDDDDDDDEDYYYYYYYLIRY